MRHSESGPRCLWWVNLCPRAGLRRGSYTPHNGLEAGRSARQFRAERRRDRSAAPNSKPPPLRYATCGRFCGLAPATAYFFESPPFDNFTFISAATTPAMYPSTPQACKNAKPVANIPNLIVQSTM